MAKLLPNEIELLKQLALEELQRKHEALAKYIDNMRIEHNHIVDVSDTSTDMYYNEAKSMIRRVEALTDVLDEIISESKEW